MVKIIPSSLKTLFNSLTKLLNYEKLDFDIITFEFEVTTPDIRHTVKILCFPNTVLNVGNRIEWSPISSPNLSDMGFEISFINVCLESGVRWGRREDYDPQWWE